MSGTLERIIDELQEFIEMLQSDMEILISTEAKKFNSNIISDLKEMVDKYKEEKIMAKEYRISVYNEYGGNEIVGRVRYNAALDYWDGRNWSNGGVGMHKGISKLKDGRYVIIIGTQWQGQRDYAYVVDPDTALQEIFKAGHSELLDTKKVCSSE